jgi:hypothetical protein
MKVPLYSENVTAVRSEEAGPLAIGFPDMILVYCNFTGKLESHQLSLPRVGYSLDRHLGVELTIVQVLKHLYK